MARRYRRYRLEEKIRLVNKYRSGGRSLRAYARASGVPAMTFWSWVRSRRLEKGKTRRITSPALEKEVVMLKERTPGLTAEKARLATRQAGIDISRSGIWRIWQRHAYCRMKTDRSLSFFSERTPATDQAVSRARRLFDDGRPQAAARILNRLISMPENPLIGQVPYTMLSARRKLDQLIFKYDVLPLNERRIKLRRLRRQLEAGGYHYSAMVGAIIELQTLDRLRRIGDKNVLLGRLEKVMQGIRDPVLNFRYNFYRAATYFQSLRVKEGLDHVKKCRRLVAGLEAVVYHDAYAKLLTYSNDNRKILRIYGGLLRKNPSLKNYYRQSIAHYCYLPAGRYDAARRMLDSAADLRESPNFSDLYHLSRARIALAQGRIADSQQGYHEALQIGRKIGILNTLFACALGMAASARLLNRKKTSAGYLRKYLPLMREKLPLQAFILRCLLNSRQEIPRDLKMKNFTLLELVQKARRSRRGGDYRRMYNYARRNMLLGLLHSWLLINPEPVFAMLARGRPTGLPRPVLQSAVFNPRATTYRLRFLGRLIVEKDERYLRTALTPKEQSLLIHLARQAAEPGRFIGVAEIERNFWPDRHGRPTSLASMLMNIRRSLEMPAHLFEFRPHASGRVLANRSVYFTTDHGELRMALAQARALWKAEEYLPALKEFRGAFRLVRGAPLAKAFDNWSLDLRQQIINEIGNELRQFVRAGADPHHYRCARQLLLKMAAKVAPPVDGDEPGLAR